MSLSLLLRTCEAAITRRLQPALTQAGLTTDTWRIMTVLLERPGLGMASIAEAAVLPNASLTRHMDHLIERGLVVRRTDPSDKRRAVAALSPRGEHVARDLSAREGELEAAIAQRLGDGRLQELIHELALVSRSRSRVARGVRE